MPLMKSDMKCGAADTSFSTALTITHTVARGRTGQQNRNVRLNSGKLRIIVVTFLPNDSLYKPPTKTHMVRN